ncbi:Uncharacterised protein [Zhongshania aliphaticivorans]|uniref:Uncharacterized protein n=1 Tax=Zhongshania aliphaticivorans TaxID=1470434 RepID=A0A5S9NZM4_9GAMM|nr:hypothetical protein [Zhongshania aliphaticivorans]CAA0089462.1 Uncharacterised protein [Zhongshania aliphaticivorans]CAA0096260.1 Uncharacterised protein [Zhongshania aliphaticivorans]
MLIASYLLGFDDVDTVRHLAVDSVLPEQLQHVEIRLFSRVDGTLDIVDLFLLFPNADSRNKIVCLPSIPLIALNHIMAGKALEVIDFAHGRKLSLVYSANQQRCA